MQIPRLFTLISAFCLLTPAAQSANVLANSLASGPGGTPPARDVVSTTGANLATGSLVRVGYFNNAQGNMAILTGNNFAAINNLFLSLGEDSGSAADGETGPITIAASGDIAGSIANVDNAYMPAGRELYCGCSMRLPPPLLLRLSGRYFVTRHGSCLPVSARSTCKRGKSTHPLKS